MEKILIEYVLNKRYRFAFITRFGVDLFKGHLFPFISNQIFD